MPILNGHYVTQNEYKLQTEETLDMYKSRVSKEAKHRLLNRYRVVEFNITHLRAIKNKDNFESDVQSLVHDTLSYL